MNIAIKVIIQLCISFVIWATMDSIPLFNKEPVASFILLCFINWIVFNILRVIDENI